MKAIARLFDNKKIPITIKLVLVDIECSGITLAQKMGLNTKIISCPGKLSKCKFEQKVLKN